MLDVPEVGHPPDAAQGVLASTNVYDGAGLGDGVGVFVSEGVGVGVTEGVLEGTGVVHVP
jgi:hypothetical protein